MSSDEEKIKVVRNATDLQRLKLEKLMKNPEKPAFIPDKSKEKRFPNAPEFVRNVMGSSAGAGSGEFHVYRHIRRREYARQEYLNQLSEKDRLDLEYKEKLEANQRITEDRAAKKRGKRQRAKQRLKAKRRKGGDGGAKKDSSSESEELTDDDEEGAGAADKEEEDDKKEEEQEQSQAAASGAVVSHVNKADAPVEDSDVRETRAADEGTSKGDSRTPVEQKDDANMTISVASNEGEAQKSSPAEEAMSRSPDKPQKKSLKELLKTTASKLNLDLNIDR